MPPIGPTLVVITIVACIVVAGKCLLNIRNELRRERPLRRDYK